MTTIYTKPLTDEAFAPYGDVIDTDRPPDFAINQGMCQRYHGLARPEIIGEDGSIGISLGRSKPYSLPLDITMMERHPLGSQAFIPLSSNPFLVVVAKDNEGHPAELAAFLTKPGQGVNYHCNIWHAVLTPLEHDADFIIIDRLGTAVNLEEFHFTMPFVVMAG